MGHPRGRGPWRRRPGPGRSLGEGVCSRPATRAAGDPVSVPAPGELLGWLRSAGRPERQPSSEGTQRRISRKPRVWPFSPRTIPPASSEPCRAPCSTQEEELAVPPSTRSRWPGLHTRRWKCRRPLRLRPITPQYHWKGQPHCPAHGFQGHRVERAFCKADSCLKPGSPCPPVPSRPTLANAGVVPAGLAGAQWKGVEGSLRGWLLSTVDPRPPMLHSSSCP